MIEVVELRKLRGSSVAVDGMTFSTRPGRITAFLGPNGSGKTSTFRMIAGLDRPSSGYALVAGRPPAQWPEPARTLGAVVDGPALHPTWRVEDHLRILAATHRLPASRVEEVIDAHRLTSYRRRRARELSLGMRQQVALAMAVLGDPRALLLDEPANGLDPEAMVRLRDVLRVHADAGGHVLLSTHLMHEVAELADDVIVIDRGRLLWSSSLPDFVAAHAPVRTLVNGPDLRGLHAALGPCSETITNSSAGLLVTGASAGEVGHLAFLARCEVSLLQAVTPSLEDLYLAFLADRTEGAAA